MRNGPGRNAIVSLAALGGLCLFPTSCFEDKDFFKQQREEALPVVDIASVEQDGAVIATVSSKSTTVQKLTASADSEIKEAFLSLPPSSLALDTEITIEQGAPLASTAAVKALGLGETAIEQSAPTVVISSSLAIDASVPMTIGVPAPQAGGLRLADADIWDRLVVLYKAVKASEDGAVVQGLMTRSKLRVENGVVFFDTSYFGAYQAAITDVKVEEVVEVPSAQPIISVREEKILPSAVWTPAVFAFDALKRVVEVSAVVSGVESVNACGLVVDNDKAAPWLFSKAIGDVPKGQYEVPSREASTVFAKFECTDNYGRVLISEWSEFAIPVGDLEPPAPFVVKAPKDIQAGGAVTVTWEAAKDAVAYDFALSLKKDCSAPAHVAAAVKDTRFVTPVELPEGIWHACVSAADAHGNVRQATNNPFVFEVAFPVPDTSFITLPPAATNIKTLPVALACTLQPCKYEQKIDAGAWMAVPAQGVVALTPGPHQLEFRAVSAKGKRDQTPLPHAVVIDQAPPAAASGLAFKADALNETAATLDNDTEFFLEWKPPTDVLSGIARIAALIHSQAGCQGTATEVIAAQGSNHIVNIGTAGLTYSFKVKAADAAGNESVSACSGPFRVDAVPPSVQIFAPTAHSGAPFAVNIAISEPVNGLTIDDIVAVNATVSGLTLLSPGSPGAGPAYSINVSPLSTGQPVTLSLPAGAFADAAGNGNPASAPASIGYQVPQASLMTPANAVAGLPFNVGVAIKDGNGALITSANGSVQLACTGVSVSCGSVSVNAGQGQLQMSGTQAGVADIAIGSSSFGNLQLPAARQVVVEAGQAATASFNAPASGSVNQAFNLQVIVKDQFGNQVTGFNAAVNLGCPSGFSGCGAINISSGSATAVVATAVEGNHSFTVSGLPGGLSPPSVTVIVSDGMAPGLSILSPAYQSLVNAAAASALAVSGTCSEWGRPVLLAGPGALAASPVCLNGSWSALLNVSAVSDGPFMLNITHWDAVGAGVSASLELFKDTTPPSPAVALFQPSSSPANDASPTFQVWGLAPADSIGFYDDNACSNALGGGGGSNPAYFDIALPADGPYTLYHKAQDAAGNVGTCLGPFSYDLDRSPPAVTVSLAFGAADAIIDDADKAANAALISVTANGYSGNLQYLVNTRNDNCGTKNDAAFALSIPGAAALGWDGDYFVCVRAKDAAGNVTNSVSPQITVDVAGAPAACAHRFWRVRPSPPLRPEWVVRDIALRDGVGGLDVSGEGNHIRDNAASMPAASAFDGLPGTTWNSALSALDAWVGVDFGPNTANHRCIQEAWVSVETPASRGGVYVESSANGTTWNIAFGFEVAQTATPAIGNVNTVMPQSMRPRVFRSVQPGATGVLVAGTISNEVQMVGSVMTFETPLPQHVGIGDAIAFDSDGNSLVDSVAFVERRISSLQFRMQNSAGEPFQAPVGLTQYWSAYRAYTSLANAFAAVENTGIPSAVQNFDAFTGGNDLVARGKGWHLAAYAGNDTAHLSIPATWQTSENFPIMIETPHEAHEVGISQRHDGDMNSGAGYTYRVTSGNLGIGVHARHVGFSGIRFSNHNTANDVWMLSLQNLGGPSSLYLRGNLFVESVVSFGAYGVRVDDPGAKVMAFSNIFLGFNHSSSGKALGVVNGAETKLYNNTFAGNYISFFSGGGMVRAVNNLATGCNQQCFSVSGSAWFSGDSARNASSDGTAPGIDPQHGISANLYADLAGQDLHLNASATGFDLVDNDGVVISDPQMPKTDIDSHPRPQGGPWSIGADQHASVPLHTACPGGSTYNAWRVAAAGQPNGPWQVNEIRFYHGNQDVTGDLQPLTDVEADSFTAGYGPERAFNGQTADGWRSQSGQGAWMEANFPAGRCITGLDVLIPSIAGITPVRVEYLDAGVWREHFTFNADYPGWTHIGSSPPMPPEASSLGFASPFLSWAGATGPTIQYKVVYNYGPSTAPSAPPMGCTGGTPHSQAGALNVNIGGLANGHYSFRVCTTYFSTDPVWVSAGQVFNMTLP